MGRVRRRAGKPTSICAGALALAGTALGAGSLAAAADRAPTARAAQSAPALRYGIYSGGEVGGSDRVFRAEHVSKDERLARIRQLRGDAAFVLHEYVAFHNAGSLDEARRHVADVLADARATGSQAEIVLRYQPDDGLADPVQTYCRFVDGIVRAFARDDALAGIQITNEANIRNAPDAADGSYPGVRDALVYGIQAATIVAEYVGRPDLPIGFNMAVQPGDIGFWRDVAATGGGEFVARVDYVGLDVYPGTWPTTMRRPPSDARVARDTTSGVRRVATRMRALGLPATTPIHLAETGYPTGPGRGERDQARVMRATIRTVQRLRRAYPITDLRWFDLRDADSSAAHFEARYGLLRDDLTPKRAFHTLRKIIARSARR